jgi:hypothetical protein
MVDVMRIYFITCKLDLDKDVKSPVSQTSFQLGSCDRKEWQMVNLIDPS